jgi:hypothetical protein
MSKLVEEIPEVKPLLRKKKAATLLKPQRARVLLPFSVSKMGGTPNLNLFERWPECDSCRTPLNFILQIYREEFPEFYFPGTENIFLLFRCPNFFCEGAFDGHHDLKMFWFYGNVTTDENKAFETPQCTSEDFEQAVADCAFRPTRATDYLHVVEQTGEWEKFEEKYIEDIDVIDEFMSKYQPKPGIKINGFPDWVDTPDYPVCTCGNTKEFFFQLSSEEEGEEPSVEWPPYAPVMGESGNLYFFVCQQCGSESIETRWESYL